MNKFSLALGATGIALLFVFAWFASPALFSAPSRTENVRIAIPSGCDAACAARLLRAQRIISSQAGYLLYAAFDSAAQQPRPGQYLVRPGTSYRRLARLLARDPDRQEISISIIEGWTLRDEARAMERAAGSSDALALFYRSVGDASRRIGFDQTWRQTFSFLSSLPADATLEGYLFPDTYRVWKDDLPNGLIQKQLMAFSTHARRLTDEAAVQGRTLHDVVILASIVEKEVARIEDRHIVAGIFLQRLRESMPLQSDATINYITHAGRARPTLLDLESVSPYNTYQHRGLPPGPISNPSASALEAALHPAQTAFRYFLTDHAGKIYFAKTFAEHQRNRKLAFGE